MAAPPAIATLAAFIEATAWHHPGVTSAFMTTVIYAAMYIQYFGTPEQQQEFLPQIIEGKRKMAVAYTEPSGGSDAAAIKTRAVRDGDDYVHHGPEGLHHQRACRGLSGCHRQDRS